MSNPHPPSFSSPTRQANQSATHFISVLLYGILAVGPPAVAQDRPTVRASAADPEQREEPQPYRLNVTYYAESWQNVDGGLSRGNAYLDKLDVSAAVDGGELFGVDGLHFFMRAFAANGHTLSCRLTGDNQGVSNIETIRSARVFELWGEWQSEVGGKTRFGLYDLNSEFDSVASAQFFLNSSHGIGRDFSQSGRMGPSIYPISSLGVRSLWIVASGWSGQMAVLDGVPGDPQRPKVTTVHISPDDGALIVGEADYSQDFIHKVGLGVWRYTSHFDTVGTGAGSVPAIAHPGNTGIYGLLDLTLTPAAGKLSSRVDGFVRVGYADPQVNRFGTYAEGGLVFSGLLVQDDHLGLAAAATMNGSPYQRAADLAGIPQRRAETNIEASWAVPVSSGL
ncbi:MAG TPA: carbohydrate porin, partial [Steroidobacteraceae bacterium]